MSYMVHCFDVCGNPSQPLPVPPDPWSPVPIVPPTPILNITCPVIPANVSAATAAPFRITVNGTLFTASTQGTFDGTPMPSTVVSATQLWFNIDPAAYTPGPHTIGVTDGGVIGATTCPFTIDQVLIVPTITAIYPDYVGRQGPTVTVTVNGTNFDATSQVTYNGVEVLPTTLVSPTQLTAQLDPNVTKVGGFHIRVANGPFTNSSPTYVICNVVHNPTVVDMLPKTWPADGTQPTVTTIVGDYYGDTAKVLVDGVEVTTTRLSGGALDFTMPPESAPVTRQISVRLGHAHAELPAGHDNVGVVVAPLSLPFVYT